MFTLSVFLNILLTTSLAHADIYTYKDSNGNFYFTDNQMDESYRLLSVFRSNLTQQSNNNYSFKAYQQNKVQFLPLIQAAARQFEVDADLIHAIVDIESAFNPRAVSKAGASGLMQLMPKTAQGLGVKDRFNPQQNIQGGTRYFSQLLARFDGSNRLALAAYNAGPTAVSNAGNSVPNYPETKRYVVKVMNKYQSLK